MTVGGALLCPYGGRVSADDTTGAPGIREGRRLAKGRFRAVAAAVVLALGVALVPVSVAAAWGRVVLVDTERFVATLAPLADDPAVQRLVAARATAALTERADVDRRVSDLVAGLAALDLPPRAEAGLPVLEAAAVEGVRGLIERAVTDLVASERFRTAWVAALRTGHAGAVRALTWDGGGVVTADDGILTLRLDAVIDAARGRLEAEGWGTAIRLPEVSVVVTLGSAESFLAARTVYGAAVTAGAWLPWATLVVLAAGVLLARRRVRAVVWAAGAVAAVAAVAVVAIAAGRGAFAAAAGDAGLAAGAVYDAATAALSSAYVIVGAVALAALVVTVLVRRGIRAAASRKSDESVEQ